MFGFVIKKAFFDLWDNFLPAMILNLGFVVLLSVPVFVPQYAGALGTWAAFVAFAVGVVVIFVYLGGVHGLSRVIADFESVSWARFLESVKEYAPTAIAFALVFGLHIGLLAVGLPIYGAFNNFLGLFAIAVLFWMSVIWWLAAQYVFPVRTRLSDRFVPVVKKSLLLTFDNVAFSIALAIGGVVILAVSFVTAFLVPGIAGLAIWYQVALRARLYKYDYLETHPEARRNEIPWDELLYDDRERVGKRTLRGMIFPWKE